MQYLLSHKNRSQILRTLPSLLIHHRKQKLPASSPQLVQGRGLRVMRDMVFRPIFLIHIDGAAGSVLFCTAGDIAVGIMAAVIVATNIWE